MKILFMGTPDFAVHSLNALIASQHEVTAVFTQPDKPRNRGKKVSFSPVKETALQHSIPVFHQLSGNEELLAVDCVIVAAYGVIIPERILKLPIYGCLNIHASLLPKYRGAAPINRCIMDGENESGITIMQMDKGLDTGDMLLKESVVIDEDMTATQLHDSLAEIGGRLIVQALDNIDSLKPIKQDDNLATYAAKITKAECEIDLAKTAEQIINHIRGLADYPCAYTNYEGKRIKIYRAAEGVAEGIVLNCSDGMITLTEIQPEGKKRMSASDYLRGIKGE